MQLDPARTRLISGFVDTYLQLSQLEEQVFQEEIGRLEPAARESAMEIVTSWMRAGIEQGRQETKVEIVQRMLVENLPLETIARITGLTPEQIQHQAAAQPPLE